MPARFLIPESKFVAEYDIGRFPDVAPDVGLDVFGNAGGAVMDDFDGDQDLDVVFSSQALTGQLRYFSNDGDGTFTERTREAGLDGLWGGLNVNQTDYNNDGRLDLFVLRGAWLGEEGRHPNSLLRNNGDGSFTDVTEAAGLLAFNPTQVGAWGDFDNNGWVDLFVGNEMLDPGMLQGHGIAFGDIDNDGDQDVLDNQGGAYAGDGYQKALYLNPGHGNHWVTLVLEGSEANRAAIGARLKVTLATAAGPREIHATVGNGSSFGGNSLRQEIGLGDAERIEQVEVTWPGSGRVQKFEDLAMDRGYRLREGAAVAEPLELRPAAPLTEARPATEPLRP